MAELETAVTSLAFEEPVDGQTSPRLDPVKMFVGHCSHAFGAATAY